jgi:hypothetical protein
MGNRVESARDQKQKIQKGDDWVSKTIYKKLFEIQKQIPVLKKDSETKEYAYLSDERLLGVVRPLMDECGLMLTVQTTGRSVRADETKSGTTRYFTEIDITFTWVDVDTGETLEHTFTAQGVDLAGEKGIGKALTYGEKYYLLKLFHIPTPKDDPDGDGVTKSGEKKTKGTQAATELRDFQRKAVTQMVKFFSGGDAAKVGEVVTFFTHNKAADYAGVTTVDEIGVAALPVVYANMLKAYLKKTGNEFKYVEDSAE